jgi:shikimate kinase
MRLILITGPKHSGKTLCAHALRIITGREAADLDALVEQMAGKNPRALFKEGPEIFRRVEAEALASVMRQNRNDLIIAAGGGLADNPEALALLARNREVFIVYLDVSAETAWQRILHTAAGGELPPFLNTENPRETHFALHERRAKAYRALAHFTIDAENKTPDGIAREIARHPELG